MTRLVAEKYGKRPMCWKIFHNGYRLGTVTKNGSEWLWDQIYVSGFICTPTRDEASLELARACGITDAVAPEVWP